MSLHSIDANGETIRMEAAPALAEQARFVLTKVASLRTVSHNDTVDFGWARFVLVCEGNTTTVLEPSFVKGGGLRNDTSRALVVLSRQLEMTRLVGVAAEEAKHSDTFIYLPSRMTDQRVYMERAADCDAKDSGWFVGAADARENAQSDMVARPTCELLSLRPALLDALLLPSGYMVFWDGDTIEAVVSPANVNVWTPEMATRRAAWPKIPA